MKVDNKTYEEALNNRDNQMIMHSAGARFIRSLDEDEIHRCKLMALWKALQKWRRDRGNKFTNFLYQQVRWECLKSVKQQSKFDIQVEWVDQEVLPDTPLQEIFDCLPLELRNIVEKRYVYNMTLREIGDECGCCYETVRKKLHEATTCIKTALMD